MVIERLYKGYQNKSQSQALFQTFFMNCSFYFYYIISLLFSYDLKHSL